MINRMANQTAVLPGDMVGKLKPQNLQQAAEQFEGLFLRTLLQQMRKATDALNQDGLFSSQQQRTMRDFYDDHLADCLSMRHSVGIAEMIIKQLAPKPAAFKLSE